MSKYRRKEESMGPTNDKRTKLIDFVGDVPEGERGKIVEHMRMVMSAIYAENDIRNPNQLGRAAGLRPNTAAKAYKEPELVSLSTFCKVCDGIGIDSLDTLVILTLHNDFQESAKELEASRRKAVELMRVFERLDSRGQDDLLNLSKALLGKGEEREGTPHHNASSIVAEAACEALERLPLTRVVKEISTSA